ncbi:MAG: lipopolysaccharide A protein [Bacteroidales bacterium]|nr:lipopolysaccharide A protein [Candidatus Physcousia equi]
MKKIDLHKFFHRISFYVHNFGVYYMPKAWRRMRLERLMKSLTEEERKLVEDRTGYYARFSPESKVPQTYRECGEEMPSIVPLKDYRYPWHKKHKFSAYFLDLYRAVGAFEENYDMAYLFGDITQEYEFPFFVKTRPVRPTTNSVVMKLDSERHFQWVKDKRSFASKKPMAVSRNVVRRQPWRALLLEKYWNHPLCNFGMVNRDAYTEHPEWVKDFMTKDEQLGYKFIMTIEGHDVATNLKWVMSSNSIAVMPKPKYESWFMEGTLKPNYHYIEVKDDYSDLEEKLQYYIDHPQEAEAIVQHAHEYVRQFQNYRLELAIQYNVARRYFASCQRT